MKKLLLTTLIIAVSFIGSQAAHAQGRIQFAIPTTQRTIDFQTGTPLFGPAGTFEYGLYIGPAGSTAAQLTLVGTAFNPASTSAASGTAGLFGGTNPYLIPAIPGVTLDGSVPIAFMVKCWLAANGSSLEEAYASNDPSNVFGWSLMGYVTPTLPPTGAPAIFGTGAGQIQGFSFGNLVQFPPLSNVPEPSTIAIGNLGAVALLRFRPRR